MTGTRRSAPTGRSTAGRLGEGLEKGPCVRGGTVAGMPKEERLADLWKLHVFREQGDA